MPLVESRFLLSDRLQWKHLRSVATMDFGILPDGLFALARPGSFAVAVACANPIPSGRDSDARLRRTSLSILLFMLRNRGNGSPR